MKIADGVDLDTNEDRIWKVVWTCGRFNWKVSIPHRYNVDYIGNLICSLQGLEASVGSPPFSSGPFPWLKDHFPIFDSTIRLFRCGSSLVGCRQILVLRVLWYGGLRLREGDGSMGRVVDTIWYCIILESDYHANSPWPTAYILKKPVLYVLREARKNRIPFG